MTCEEFQVAARKPFVECTPTERAEFLNHHDTCEPCRRCLFLAEASGASGGVRCSEGHPTRRCPPGGTRKPCGCTVGADKLFGLDAEERRTLDHLVEAWNRFCALLPMPDSASSVEFAAAINTCQDQIARRVAKRADPDVWR